MKRSLRQCGILLAISSLPSKYGIGTFSSEAYDFVDFLKKSGQSLWQILPLGPTGYGDSPYQSFSTFAGNPYYIDLEEFIDYGWISEKDCEKYNYGNEHFVEYNVIFDAKFALLKKAFKKSGFGEKAGATFVTLAKSTAEKPGVEKVETEKPGVERSAINSTTEEERSFADMLREEFEDFVMANSSWLEDYALYMSVKDSLKGISWTEWPEDIKLRRPKAVKEYSKKLEESIRFYNFQQFFFYRQWKKLKMYANNNGIQIVGDIPIYVAMDSADTWANPELFELDKDCRPINVAGCPPDAFTAKGQLWGNPLYRWDYLKETGYEWWMKRMAHSFEMVDIIRIDHFRGFDEYYAIPFGREDAVIGSWKKGPGLDLFKTMKEKLGDRPVIAEDLGFLTNSVRKMVKKSGFPGMKVLQFAFDSREESDYLPHNYDRNCVVYTGTHDNDTSRHWFDTLAKADKSFAKRYLDIKSPKDAVNRLIRAALSSVADTCIIPMQDYLELGGEARMNFPSTLGYNWKWRMDCSMTSEEQAEEIRKLCKLYGRVRQ